MKREDCFRRLVVSSCRPRGPWNHFISFHLFMYFLWYYFLFLIIFYWLCYYSCPDFSPFAPLPSTPYSLRPSLHHCVCMSIAHAYKFFGYSISYTVLCILRLFCNYLFVLLFKKYILLIMLLQLFYVPPLVPSALHTLSHPHSPPL